MTRRAFAKTSAACLASAPTLLGAAAAAVSAIDDIPAIDTHIHLFDTTRPQGVPWPKPEAKHLYRPALPARLRDLAVRRNVRGAIEVECSPWLEDNQWVLDVAADDTYIVGMIGNLEPGRPDFGRHLARFAKNPLYRGIRYGNLWGRDMAAELDKPAFLDDLRRLADERLVLDTANPDLRLLQAVVRLTDAVPNLTVIVDHLPGLNRSKLGDRIPEYDALLARLGQRPQIYVKISQVLRRGETGVSHELGTYRETLDRIFGTFGEDRMLFGSDWPNSDTHGTYDEVMNVVRAYFATKSRAVAEKYFWKNSIAAYGWRPREPGQSLS